MSKTRHITAVALIALLVLSPIASIMGPAGPVGSASADSGGCSVIEWITSPATCSAAEAIDEPSDDVTEYSAKLDAYRDAKSIEAQTKTALTAAENSVHDAENQGWLDAEQAFLEAYLDGGNLSESKQAGVEAMQSHYTTRQTNLVELQNNIITSLYGIQNSSAHFSMPGDVQSMQYSIHTYDQYPAIQLRTTDFYKGYMTGYYDRPHQISIDLVGLSAEPVELVDGTTTPATTVDFESPNSTLYALTEQNNWVQAQYDESTELNYMTQNQYHLLEGEVRLGLAPSSGTASDDRYKANISSIRSLLYPDAYPEETAKISEITDPSRWGSVWNDYQQSYQENVASFGTWAEGSYQGLENDTVSADDVLSRLNEMELTADIDWQNATFNDGVVALSAMGLAAPGGSTAYMNISYQTSYNGTMQTTTGLLMSQTNPPEGTWQTNLTYNSSQLDGAQVIMHLDGNQTSIKGDFRINGAYDANGTTIEGGNITVDQATYEATNLTDLRQEIQNLSERIGTLRNRSLSTGGGGAPAVAWPDLGIPNPFTALGAVGQWIALFGVLFVALLLLTVVS